MYPGTSRCEIFRRISIVLHAASDLLPNSIRCFFCIWLAVSSWYWQHLWFALYTFSPKWKIGDRGFVCSLLFCCRRLIRTGSLGTFSCSHTFAWIPGLVIAIASVTLQPTCGCALLHQWFAKIIDYTLNILLVVKVGARDFVYTILPFRHVVPWTELLQVMAFWDPPKHGKLVLIWISRI